METLETWKLAVIPMHPKETIWKLDGNFGNSPACEPLLMKNYFDFTSQLVFKSYILDSRGSSSIYK